ncbi:MAG TPA: DUF5916 domain-containing protein [Vicinamibacterales bacterium]|nr:DUF5916 domain-containing protein [Vicinamibacterales bacterium]
MRTPGFLFAALFVAASAGAQPFDITKIDPETFRAMAVRIPPGQTPHIDGRLDEEVWTLGPASGDFVQREPDFGAPSTERTEFRILYDDRKIYFGVWLWDSDPSGIMGNEMKRDSGLRRGDQLKIVIDTFHDHRNGFYFSTNPLAALKDANTVENGRTINYDWNIVWENETSVDDQGWYVEIAIPFSQLRFRTTVGESTWGLNLCRIIMRKNEEAYWVPFPREWTANGFARLSNAGVITGLHDLRARRRMELLPYVSPRVQRDFTGPVSTESRTDVGFDFKVGVTDDLIADITYNTDFAQVEADQEVVNLTRFSLFFPEKRQFFTESIGIFDYGKSASSPGGDAAASDPGILPVFYSRRIGLDDGQEVPLIGGGKLTGKVGPYSVGVMNITTDAADVREGGDSRLIDRANYTALRVKRNILSKSSIGAILLNREGGVTDYNRSVGVDVGLMLGPSFTVIGLVARTDSPDAAVADRPGSDVAAVADVGYRTERFSTALQYSDIGARFNPEMGFVTRTDVRATKARAAWTPRPRWRGVRQMFFRGDIEYYEDHEGRLESRSQQFDARLSRQDSSSVRLGVSREHDVLSAPFTTAGTELPIGGYSWTSYSAGFNSNQARRVYGSVNGEAGGYYNGDRQSIRAAVNFQLGRTLLLEPNYTKNWITLPGRPTYETNTLNFRVSQSFSPDLFVKGFVQYNDERRTASFNFLFWYIYKPGSDLYIVYNEGRETDLAGRSSIGSRQGWSRPRNRSLALKMTYWLAR